METTTRYVGNCQICEGDQKLHEGRMVHHGYRRPGDGMIHGDCPGVGEVPYEVSRDLVKSYKASVEREKAMMGELHDRMVQAAEDNQKARRAATPPLVNFPGEGYVYMTKAEYAKLHRDYKGTRMVRGARVRSAMVRGGLCAIYLTDMKRTDPPEAEGSDAPPRFNDRTPDMESALDERAVAHAAVREVTKIVSAPAKPAWVDATKDALKAGVQVVSAPQLFPTPPELAKRMVELADIQPNHRVLEPSAGTGNLIRAIDRCAGVTAIEVDPTLVECLLRFNEQARCADFLNLTTEELGTFDRILMNPPFENATDVEHIRHALTFLKPGGKLVAICANGPRQQEKLGATVKRCMGTWEDLPEGTFKSSGANVRTALIVIERSSGPSCAGSDPGGGI